MNPFAEPSPLPFGYPPLDVIRDLDLSVAIDPRVEVLRHSSTEKQRHCERVTTVDELIERLKSVARP